MRSVVGAKKKKMLECYFFSSVYFRQTEEIHIDSLVYLKGLKLKWFL